MHIGRQREFPVWILFIGLAFLLLAAYGVTDRIDRAASLPEADVQAERIAAVVGAIAQRRHTAKTLTTGYEKCPAAKAGMTDIVTMVIRGSGDGRPEVLTCIRYAERPFVPRAAVKRPKPKTVMAQGEQ